MKIKISSLLGAVIFLIGSSIIAYATARLPFPDGSYASQAKFCKMNRSQAYSKSELALYDIKGSEVSLYESSCEISGISITSKTVKFKQLCESEGETMVSRVTWIRRSATSFSDEQGTVWTACGKFVH